jgi:hypothetical protein
MPLLLTSRIGIRLVNGARRIVMTAIVVPGEEYTPRVAAAFAELLEAIAENLRNADGTGVVVREGDDADLCVLLNLDTDLPIHIATSR